MQIKSRYDSSSWFGSLKVLQYFLMMYIIDLSKPILVVLGQLDTCFLHIDLRVFL